MQFQDWLMTRSGGSKSKKEARKNGAHCSAIFTAIGLVSLKSMGTRKTLDDIEANFIQNKIQNTTASTVKNHLLSLKRFSSYLRYHAELKDHGRNEFDRVQTQIQLWNTSLGKDIKIRTAEKNFKDQCKYYQGWV